MSLFELYKNPGEEVVVEEFLAKLKIDENTTCLCGATRENMYFATRRNFEKYNHYHINFLRALDNDELYELLNHKGVQYMLACECHLVCKNCGNYVRSFSSSQVEQVKLF